MIDKTFLLRTLERLLATPSPSGMTDAVVRLACEILDEIGVDYKLTRRGAIRAVLPGAAYTPKRAIAAHLDTLGAMVKALKPNGRLEIVPIGFWSSRFAEGARVTVYGDTGTYRGTVLPIKASGHTYNKEIDTLPVDWTQVELRLDADTASVADLMRLGVRVGDTIAVDPGTEFGPNGYVNSRYLDDKAGVASLLAAAEAVVRTKAPLPLDVLLLFTISEEVGVGASHILHGNDVAEMISVDNATNAPGQNSSERGVTIAMMDSAGPFDWHLTRHLLALCRAHGIEHSRDVYRYYRSDAASALEAGNDIRTALVCFACDASHGWERTHEDSLVSLARLLAAQMTSAPLFQRDAAPLGPLADFPPAEVQTTPDLPGA
ncbi:MAG: osmoprotectant NAGGN system M42 family peptidase [Burkholderiaceae bacterium]|nr:osmoprotectant NAGGN system M42 family peptidase [Burkholderiaceae bacterium]